jgi:hypothetical protein
MEKLISQSRMLIVLMCSLVFLPFCNTSEIQDQIIETSQARFKVSIFHLTEFITKYEIFISSLSEVNRDLLANYLMEKDLSHNARISGSSCNCPGQNSCSCQTWFSDCCICWDPQTENGACGSYGGICACKKEAKEPQGLGRSALLETYSIIDAKNFRELLRYLERNKINVFELRTAFIELEKHAMPLDK